MRFLNIILFGFFGANLLSGCSSEGEQQSDQLCRCFKEADMVDDISLLMIGKAIDDLEPEKDEKLKRCVFKSIIEMKGDVSKMNVEDQVSHSQDILHSAIDSECYEKWLKVSFTMQSFDERLGEMLEEIE